jgi:surfeit locus 1 family protein
LRRYLIFAVAFGTAAVCIRLGVWQLDRLDQRKNINTLAEARLSLPVIELPTEHDSDSLRYRKALADGVFDFGREIVVVARSRSGVPAVHVVTPLRLHSGGAVLVERGIALSPDAKTVDLAALVESDAARVTGVLVSLEGGESDGAGWPRYVRGVNPTELQGEYPYPLLPLVLRRTARPPDAPADLTPVPLPELTNGPHLSYAVQWFSFAAIAIVGSWFLSRNLGKQSPASS